MLEVEEKLAALENCVRRFNKIDEIIFMLLTTNEHGKATYDDLVKVGHIVQELNDESLSNTYNRTLESMKVTGLFQLIHPNGFFGFLQRLGTLLNEVIVQTNEADIALRNVLGLQSGSGLWGSKGWCPSGQL
jgi:hypothetical protein